jgi:hypothetical protein
LFVLRASASPVYVHQLGRRHELTLPMTKAGLASGTLTMFRQTGTAVGVALFGRSSSTISMPTCRGLEGRDPAEVARGRRRRALRRRGRGEVRDAARASVVDGFVLMSQAGVAVATVAATSAFFLRRARPRLRRRRSPGSARRPRRGVGDVSQDRPCLWRVT